MAMFECPQCRRLIDEATKKCPNCGNDVRKYIKEMKKKGGESSAIGLGSVYAASKTGDMNVKLDFLSPQSPEPAPQVQFDSPELNAANSEPASSMGSFLDQVHAPQTAEVSPVLSTSEELTAPAPQPVSYVPLGYVAPGTQPVMESIPSFGAAPAPAPMPMPAPMPAPAPMPQPVSQPVGSTQFHEIHAPAPAPMPAPVPVQETVAVPEVPAVEKIEEEKLVSVEPATEANAVAEPSTENKVVYGSYEKPKFKSKFAYRASSSTANLPEYDPNYVKPEKTAEQKAVETVANAIPGGIISGVQPQVTPQPVAPAPMPVQAAAPAPVPAAPVAPAPVETPAPAPVSDVVFDSPSLNSALGSVPSKTPVTPQPVTPAPMPAPSITIPSPVAGRDTVGEPLFESPSLNGMGMRGAGASAPSTPSMPASMASSMATPAPSITIPSPVAGRDTVGEPLFESPSLNGMGMRGTGASAPSTPSMPASMASSMATSAPSITIPSPVAGRDTVGEPLFESPSLNGLGMRTNSVPTAPAPAPMPGPMSFGSPAPAPMPGPMSFGSPAPAPMPGPMSFGSPAPAPMPAPMAGSQPMSTPGGGMTAPIRPVAPPPLAKAPAMVAPLPPAPGQTAPQAFGAPMPAPAPGQAPMPQPIFDSPSLNQPKQQQQYTPVFPGAGQYAPNPMLTGGMGGMRGMAPQAPNPFLMGGAPQPQQFNPQFGMNAAPQPQTNPYFTGQ